MAHCRICKGEHVKGHRATPGGSSTARLESELMYARLDYSFWARQDQRLTRDEYAQKMQAERRVSELEAALARAKKKVR